MSTKIKIILFTIFAFLILACLIISIVLLTTIENNKNNQDNIINSNNIIYKNDSISNEFAVGLLQRINKSVDPCEDFYEYACGNWQINNPTPNYTSSWTLYDVVSQNVGKLVEDSIVNFNVNDASDGLIKAKQFYDTCMNTKLTEQSKGIQLGKLLHSGEPENDKFNKFIYNNGKWPIIDNSWSQENVNISLEGQIGFLKREFGIDTFIYTYAMGYDLQSNLTILLMTGEMLPLGLGIFSQENYFNDKVMNAYNILQEKIAYLLARDSNFTLLNGKINKDDLKIMLQIEIDLAEVIVNVYMQPNSTTSDDLYSLLTLQKVLPNFAWKDYLSNLLPKEIYNKILTGKKLINLDSLLYISEVKKLLLKYRYQDIQNYMIWRLIKYSLPYMSIEYTQALANFTSILYGKSNQVTPINETCLSYVRGNYEMPNLGYAVTEAFVKKNFNNNTKNDVSILIKNVKESLEYIMLQSSWMDDITKSNALKKAIFMKTFTAYPDWVLNKTLQNIYYENLLAPEGITFVSLNLMLRSWAVIKNFQLIDTQPNFLDFHGPPVATDAWYTATANSFSIPIGELQPPFYKYGYPDAANYGAVGAVAGHEMSHGFDAMGHQYDEYGNLNDWWTNKSEIMFNEKLVCIENQFNKYCYSGIGCINGKNTVNENVADLAGLKAALKAYEINKITFSNKKEERLQLIPEYTMDQLFYLNFASFWCGKESNESLKMSLNEDSHSPGKYRVIGTLQNIPEFSRTFSCNLGSKMNPINKCSIW
ncbi:Phosphate-regulating neutral endopeptidase [Strongyloides ratti]|uniref:Phosphate-regulating neutral endopeptidase n=1 Tax=Strongyloides ratti TaxID=34506 RepID=A0A090L4E0_STRRB|nr:Phosphate-regulating neutral endopeptidase [Strongyloides ratti]CEF62987.1 Phosphate-regulating neutral endopeptidase [Strongyloides ratti]